MQLSPWLLAVKKKHQQHQHLSLLQHQLLMHRLQPLPLLLMHRLQPLLQLHQPPSNTSLIQKSRFRAAFFRVEIEILLFYSPLVLVHADTGITPAHESRAFLMSGGRPIIPSCPKEVPYC